MGLWGRFVGFIREVFTGAQPDEPITQDDVPDYGGDSDLGDDYVPTSTDYDFIAEGWRDFGDNIYKFPPNPGDLDSTYALLVHAVNKENPEDQHYFWAFSIGGFETWDEWYAYIDSLIDAYAAADWETP